MNGPRIFLIFLVLGGVLLWAALAGGRGADLKRGLLETDRAFAAVDSELLALDPDFQALRSQDWLLGLSEERDLIVAGLAGLRSRRVALVTEDSADPRLRLPALRALALETDELCARAIELRRRLEGLRSLRERSAPVLERSRKLLEQIQARLPASGEVVQRAAALARALGERGPQIDLAERLLRENVDQGLQLGESTLSALNSLVEQQEALLRELP
ncbi:MAG: hypothetical protein ACT4PU_12175 [Planctomycetota bacterium]